jgi:hypothetical protein
VLEFSENIDATDHDWAVKIRDELDLETGPALDLASEYKPEPDSFHRCQGLDHSQMLIDHHSFSVQEGADRITDLGGIPSAEEMGVWFLHQRHGGFGRGASRQKQE